MTATLAEHGANITDLATRLVGGEEGTAVSAMMMEVALPAGTPRPTSAHRSRRSLANRELRRRSGR